MRALPTDMSKIATRERGELLKSFYAISLVNCYAQQWKRGKTSTSLIFILAFVFVSWMWSITYKCIRMCNVWWRWVWELGASVCMCNEMTERFVICSRTFAFDRPGSNNSHLLNRQNMEINIRRNLYVMYYFASRREKKMKKENCFIRNHHRMQVESMAFNDMLLRPILRRRLYLCTAQFTYTTPILLRRTHAYFFEYILIGDWTELVQMIWYHQRLDSDRMQREGHADWMKLWRKTHEHDPY